MKTNEALIEIPVANLFDNITYIVPIYQRDYAWTDKQIEQLLEDISSAQGNYYLGTLIVNKNEQNIYEVIDGQQRLTTLYLLKLYLLNKFKNNDTFIKIEPLKFEAREKYRKTLFNLKNINDLDDNFWASELYKGYKNIETYFNKHKSLSIQEFEKKLEKVRIVRVQVPEGIDLNHYFEIMNTRGEQLEPHQIAKARILQVLEDIKDKKIAAKVWDCCEIMDTYVQMNFNIYTREQLFSENWTDLKDIRTWDELKEKFSFDDNTEEDGQKTLKDILKTYKFINKKQKDEKEDEENERFESIITFPNFLLQVNAVLSDNENDDDSLDDKKFIDTLEDNWSNPIKAKKFILKMLQCRTLFDKYILKREYAKEYKKTGKWSLQRLEKYYDKKNDAPKPKYVTTYSLDSDDIYSENDNQTKKIRTLQSALRITYTSPKTMHWITLVLKKLLEDKNINLVELLEQYCLRKVDESEYKNKRGFDIERIVFSYLDYLLYRDNYNGIAKNDWEFQFRNSIEHFYPQNSDNKIDWEKEDCDSFGNLALITVSGNSKFSNVSPSEKIGYTNIVEQSLKLKVMKDIVEKNNKTWTPELAEEHRKEMTKILDNNGVK